MSDTLINTGGPAFMSRHGRPQHRPAGRGEQIVKTTLNKIVNTQTEAERLAFFLDEEATVNDMLRPAVPQSNKRRAAAELRRLSPMEARVAELEALNAELLEALKLADLLLSGANMNAATVERRVRAALAKAQPQQPGETT